MEDIIWSIYDVWWKKRRCHVLMPEDISQLWAIYYRTPGQMGVTMDFWGNRKGLEALHQSCAALAGKNDMAVYIPCKKNNIFSMFDFVYGKWGQPQNIDFVDLVFMKPNSLCIKDWKEIRGCIPKMKKRRWKYVSPYGAMDRCKESDYRYRKANLKAVYRFDTIFFNAVSFDYSYLASAVENFLCTDLEKVFCEDVIKNDGCLRGESYLWNSWQQYCSKKHYQFETGILFWDNEIYEKQI